MSNIKFLRTKELDQTKGKILLYFSIFVAIYWLTGNSINVYEYALLGVIYEILWIFMLASFVIIPILSIIFLIKEGFYLKSPYFIALLINIVTLLGLIYG